MITNKLINGRLNKIFRHYAKNLPDRMRADYKIVEQLIKIANYIDKHYLLCTPLLLAAKLRNRFRKKHLNLLFYQDGKFQENGSRFTIRLMFSLLLLEDKINV